MPAGEFVWDPELWRFRAEEARTIGDQMTNEEARTIMRRIAMDRLARLAARIVTNLGLPARGNKSAVSALAIAEQLALAASATLTSVREYVTTGT